MAESMEDNEAQNSNGSPDDFEDFCKNFSFLDTENCCHCNGFYGPNRNQPLCISCHQFIFPSRIRSRRLNKRTVKRMRLDNGDVTNSSSPSSSLSTSTHPQQSDRNQESENEIQRYTGTIHQPEYISNAHISELPEEILLKIFSYFDDMTLIDLSKVSQQWRDTLNVQQNKWKQATKKRWPILQREMEPTIWLKMYTALDSSCCCRTCDSEMIQNTDVAVKPSSTHIDLDKRNEIYALEMDDLTELGIRTVPFDNKKRSYQSSIVGPAGSPYDGGTFHLYIHVPNEYPFIPPTIKFLTKIIHPNVSRHGDIGLDILGCAYAAASTINQLLIFIQSFLCDPFTKVCMEPELGRLYDQDRQRFDALARHWTKKYAMIDNFSV